MTNSIPAISAKGISKRYPGVVALDQVSLVIEPGEVRAVLGKNGAGKSTLIKALTGAETPDAGDVLINGSALDANPENRTRQSAALGVCPVYQELSLVPDMTVAENMFLGNWPRNGTHIDRQALYARAAAVVKDLNFPLDPHQTIRNLGPAKRQMVEIARAMAGEPRLIILDEPTSSLAAEEVDLLFSAIRTMAKRGVAILYVSHRMKEIRAIADTATVLRDGKLVDTFTVADVTTEQVVEMMLGNAIGKINPVMSSPELGDAVLSVKGLSIPGKVQDIAFDVRRGEVLGIAGLLGSGRTEILSAIAGLIDPASGEMTYCGKPLTESYIKRIRMGIAITPESRKEDGIFPGLGVDENVVLADPKRVSAAGIFSADRIKQATRKIIEKMSVKTASQSSQIGTLSGGNQQKIVIGRWIYAGADLLLLDEPTRGVDVEAKAQIYDLVRGLANEGKSVIFVSSEVEELPLVCDRVLVLKDGTLTDEFTAPNIDPDKLLSATIN